MTCENTYQSPRWTNEILDCSLPMTFDTYSNCSFGCVYCFSQYTRGIGATKDAYLSKEVRSVNVDKIKALFKGEKPNSQFYPWIAARRPIQWGGLSDQFDGFEKRHGVTLELLKFFKEINYPICFSTKATWVFDDPRYTELFRNQPNWNMKFSIITLNKENARMIERGVPSPQKRIEAIRKWSALNPNGGATLRLRPFIIGVSDKDYEDLIRAAAEAGADAVSTEFFCLETRAPNRKNYDIISECCGFDVMKFYRKYSHGSGYLRLSRKIKEPYVRRMKELCEELGLRFYVSDAHFKELCTNSCCCGLPESWDYSRGNFSYALQFARENGRVRWADIEKDLDHLANFEWIKAEGYNTRDTGARAKFNGMSMKDFLRWQWNTPSSANSPWRLFENVLVPDGLDEDMNIIYRYNRSASLLPKGFVKRG